MVGIKVGSLKKGPLPPRALFLDKLPLQSKIRGAGPGKLSCSLLRRYALKYHCHALSSSYGIERCQITTYDTYTNEINTRKVYYIFSMTVQLFIL